MCSRWGTGQVNRRWDIVVAALRGVWREEGEDEEQSLLRYWRLAVFFSEVGQSERNLDRALCSTEV